MSGRTPPDTHPKEFSRRRTNLGSSQLPGADPMQILHPFAGSVQQYTEQLADPDRYRPDHCPQCHIKHPLTAHGFYVRTLLDTAFDGVIRVRRYLCEACRRTVSLLPDFVLPYLRSSLTVIALFLVARLFRGQTIEDAARTAPPKMVTTPVSLSTSNCGLGE